VIYVFPSIVSVSMFSTFYVPLSSSEPLWVARVTTFTVACKAYQGEPLLPLFRSFCNVGHASDWLTFQKRSCQFLGTSIFVDGEEMSFQNFMKKPGQAATLSARLADQPVEMGKLAVVDDSTSGQGVGVTEGSKKKRSITTYLDERATMIRIIYAGSSSKNDAKKQKHEDVQAAYSVHNVLSSLHCLSFKSKLDNLSFDDLVKVYDVHAFRFAMAGYMHTNEFRIMSQDYSKLKDNFVSFRSKNGLLKHEMSKHEDSLSKAWKNQDDVAKSSKDYRKELADEVERLRPAITEEVKSLTNKLKVVDLERTALIKYFLPLAIKKLMTSDHFNQVMEKVFDEVAEAFEKIEFPYISLLLCDSRNKRARSSTLRPA
ncbi:hypothetical protein Tco_1356383, partial [Tanacetum coccineum]